MKKIFIINESTSKMLSEELNTSQNIKDMLIRRIPFLKEYNIFEHPRDKNRLEAQKISYNGNVKVVIGEDIVNFDIYNVSSEVRYYSDQLNEKTFHYFTVKNTFHVSKPKEIDDLTFQVILAAHRQLEKNLSYRKEYVVKIGEEIPKDELDKIVNDMNGILFKIEEFTEKHSINLF